MMTTATTQKATVLEAELMRLSALVRERRKQLARLEKCPNKDCPCRVVWHNHVEKDLAGQVGKISNRVRRPGAKSRKPKARSK